MSKTWRKQRILIVDDEPSNIEALERLLKDEYKVIIATNGPQALEYAKAQQPPDLILLDIIMPNMDGYEVCERLKSDTTTKHIPVIFITAMIEDGAETQGLALGAVDYITKPFSPAIVKARAKTHLELKRHQDYLEELVVQRTKEVQEAYHDLKQLANSYERFVPKEFLSLLEKDSIINVELGDLIQKTLTVFFADIRDFTTLSESMTPQENFNFLNSFLSRMAPLIQKHNGFIDKYIGDAIMALFPQNPRNALDASIHIMEQIQTYNVHRNNSGYKPIQIGMGIHTGTLILGTVGFRERMEGTVISDAVNIASRVEDLTKTFGAQTIITSHVLSKLDTAHEYKYRFLGKTKVKGRKDTISIYEILDGLPNKVRDKKIETIDIFEKAVFCYLRDEFGEASALFSGVLKLNPEDKASAFYLKKCSHWLRHRKKQGVKGR